MKPVRIEFHLGETTHKQPLRLIKYLSEGGGYLWQLERGQADQRDDTAIISGLTDGVLKRISEVMNSGV